MEVDLKDVIEAIEFEGELLTHYYNKKTGIIIYVEDPSTAAYKAEDMDNIEKFEEWEIELIKVLYDFKVNFNDYIQLPNLNEINEYEMMINFCETVDDLKSFIADNNKIQLSELRTEIKNKGYLEAWYDYRENAEYNLAIKWCKDNNISYN